jgi:hypothetical protein
VKVKEFASEAQLCTVTAQARCKLCLLHVRQVPPMSMLLYQARLRSVRLSSDHLAIAHNLLTF